MKPFTPRIKMEVVFFCDDRTRLPKRILATKFMSLAICAPELHTPSAGCPSTISIAPFPHATIIGSALRISPGWPVPCAVFVLHTMNLRSPAKVNAPGHGKATARVKLRISSADLLQSMLPSSGVRRPNELAFFSSCGVRGALLALTSGSNSSSKSLVAWLMLAVNVRAVSAMSIFTLRCPMMSPASALSLM